MKKKVFAILLCAACILVVYNGVGAGNDTVTDEASEIVARRQYIQLAELLAANSGDMEKAEAVATKTTKEVVAKGGTFLEKQRLVSETVAALMAGVADWNDTDRLVIAKAIVKEALNAASEEPVAAIGIVKHAIAAMSLIEEENIILVSLIDSLSGELQNYANIAGQNPSVILGGSFAWQLKDLYKAVRAALGERIVEPDGGVVITMVSITTTTTTSTTTTTTTIWGTGVAGMSELEVVIPPTRPRPPRRPVPTTKPSPTPVGMR